MSATLPFFVFESNGLLYGVDALLVREVFFLPEVQPIPEAPRDIVGIINLRGEIVPVMDLERRFGYRSRDYQIQDSMIILECDDISLGVVVSSVLAVQEIETAQIREKPNFGRNLTAESSTSRSAPLTPSGSVNSEQTTGRVAGRALVPAAIAEGGDSGTTTWGQTRHHRFINRLAHTEDGEILLLDCRELLHYTETFELSDFEGEDTLKHFLCDPVQGAVPQFCPNATPEERQIFHDRAAALRTIEQQATVVNQLPLAIVEIKDEYFGIDLKVVREFFEVKKIVPIPCCPDRVLGNTNLRGEILTLISLHELLDLPPYTRSEVKKAVILEANDTIFGVAIDTIFDVMYLNPSEISPIPTALQGNEEGFVRGMASYRNAMLSILDIEAIVQREVLVVHEQV